MTQQANSTTTSTPTVEEISVVTVTLPNGDGIQQTVLQETESGLYFTVDASYLEQDAGQIQSPYGHGVLHFAEA